MTLFFLIWVLKIFQNMFRIWSVDIISKFDITLTSVSFSLLFTLNRGASNIIFRGVRIYNVATFFGHKEFDTMKHHTFDVKGIKNRSAKNLMNSLMPSLPY